MRFGRLALNLGASASWRSSSCARARPRPRCASSSPAWCSRPPPSTRSSASSCFPTRGGGGGGGGGGGAAAAAARRSAADGGAARARARARRRRRPRPRTRWAARRARALLGCVDMMRILLLERANFLEVLKSTGILSAIDTTILALGEEGEARAASAGRRPELVPLMPSIAAIREHEAELLSFCEAYYADKGERLITRPGHIPPTVAEHKAKLGKVLDGWPRRTRSAPTRCSGCGCSSSASHARATLSPPPPSRTSPTAPRARRAGRRRRSRPARARSSPTCSAARAAPGGAQAVAAQPVEPGRAARARAGGGEPLGHGAADGEPPAGRAAAERDAARGGADGTALRGTGALLALFDATLMAGDLVPAHEPPGISTTASRRRCASTRASMPTPTTTPSTGALPAPRVERPAPRATAAQRPASSSRRRPRPQTRRPRGCPSRPRRRRSPSPPQGRALQVGLRHRAARDVGGADEQLHARTAR